MGHVRSKTRSLGQIFEKPCVHSRDLFIVQILIKLRMFTLTMSSMKMGHVGSKTRSLGQIVESQCRRLR